MRPWLSEAAMILAAGWGTRLRPLTDELPKPLVPVGDRSVLAHVAARLEAAGFSRLVVNLHHHAATLERACAELSLATEAVLEPGEPRGTAGGVAGAAALLGEGAVLVHNADILVDMPFAALLDAHARRTPLATLAVVAGLPAGSGPVGLDGEGRVVRLRDRSVAREREGAAFVGVQLLSAEARARLPERGCLVRDFYQPAMARGAAILAAPVVKRFFDIGSPAAYLEANLAWLGDRASYLGPGASLAPGIALAAAVVGAGARVQGSGALERVVVWPGASVRAPLADAIVTRSGRIVRIRETATRS